MSTNDKPPAPQQGPAPGDAAATVPRDRYDVQAAARYKAEADLAEARRQLAEARAERDEYRRLAGAAQDERDEARAALAADREQWADAQKRAREWAEECLSARAEVARLTARLASAESERDRHRDREDEDGDRRSLRHLLVARPGPLLDAACDEIEGLRAEVARLRAQGEALADCRTARPDGPGCGACCACLGHAVSVAAAAEKAAYLRGRSEAIDDEAGFIRTAIYSIMRRPRSAEEDPTQKPRAAEAEHVADAVARLWREHVAARAAQGQGQGQGPAGPCAHVVRVVDTHPMAPGPGWDLVACERCKAVGHRARAWGGRDPGEVTWPGIGPAAPSAAEPTPQMEEPTDA